MSSKFFDSIEVRFPIEAKSVASAFESCQERKRFVEVSSDSFQGHLDLAKDDLTALTADYEKSNWRWVIIKAYYAVFHATNALLIKKSNYYSKDHICAVLALKKEGLLSDVLYAELREVYERFSDIFGFALLFEARKLSQYDVTKWKELTEKDAMLAKEFALKYVSYVEGACI